MALAPHEEVLDSIVPGQPQPIRCRKAVMWAT
jgi:hypothetical protein